MSVTIRNLTIVIGGKQSSAMSIWISPTASASD